MGGALPRPNKDYEVGMEKRGKKSTE